MAMANMAARTSAVAKSTSPNSRPPDSEVKFTAPKGCAAQHERNAQGGDDAAAGLGIGTLDEITHHQPGAPFLRRPRR